MKILFKKNISEPVGWIDLILKFIRVIFYSRTIDNRLKDLNIIQENCRITLRRLIMIEATKYDEELSLKDAYVLSGKLLLSCLFPMSKSYLNYDKEHRLTVTEKIILERVKNKQETKDVFTLFHFSKFIVVSDSGNIEYEILKIHREAFSIVKSRLGYVGDLETDKFLSKSKSINRKIFAEFKSLVASRSHAKSNALIGEISIDANKIFTMFSILSILFLISGILYNSVYFNGIGLNASEIMAPSDYIYSSMPIISLYFFICGCMFIAWMWTTIRKLKSFMIDVDFGVEPKEENHNKTKLLLFILMVSFFIGTYFFSGKVMYAFIPTLVIYICSELSDRIKVFDLFKNPVLAFYVTLTSVVLFANVFARANQDVERYYDNSEINNVTIQLSPSISSTYKNYNVLRIMSDNVILYNQDNKNDIIVLPKDKIEYYIYRMNNQEKINSESNQVKNYLVGLLN
ncbi:hypothetical protein N6C02_003252 [Vibrio fluvialis]|nr:hypothetical protein [Vibrio fluvialis]